MAESTEQFFYRRCLEEKERAETAESQLQALQQSVQGEIERLRARVDEELEHGRPSVAAAHKDAADRLAAILEGEDG